MHVYIALSIFPSRQIIIAANQIDWIACSACYMNSLEQLEVWRAGRGYKTLTTSSSNAHITDLPPPMSERPC